MISLLEAQFDFYQFRWLVCLGLNQLFILCSVNVNPLHSLIVIGVVTKPVLDILRVQDLKKIDPYSQVMRSKIDYEEDDDVDILPTDGKFTHSSKWENRQLIKELSLDAFLSLALIVYLLCWRDNLTPDFFHFVMCLSEDACHSIWTFFLWLTYKCYFMKPPQEAHIPDNLYLILTLSEGLLGLLLAGLVDPTTAAYFNPTTITILVCLSIALIARKRWPEHLTTSMFFFLGIYLTQNFVVNCLDWLLFKRGTTTGYYHDDEFLRSFSYKLY